jgi:hypothetical protein
MRYAHSTNSHRPNSHRPNSHRTIAKFFLPFLCSSLTIGSAIGLAIGTSSELPALSDTPTDRTGSTLRLENSDGLRPTIGHRTGLPQAIAKKLIQQVARETNTLPSKLRITEIKAQEFPDGCLGISLPINQYCTLMVVRGWQAIVTSPSQTFVYHLSQNANKIVQNPTASGAKRSIRVSFELFSEPGPIAATVVFQSSSSGDLTGRMSRTVLTQDGKITRYQSSPTAKFAPVLIKTLSPEQLNAFKNGLEDQRFSNLKGLSYLTAAALADYPTTTYQSPNVTTQFIDLEKKNLPRSLQQVIVNWETLIQPSPEQKRAL